VRLVEMSDILRTLSQNFTSCWEVWKVSVEWYSASGGNYFEGYNM